MTVCTVLMDFTWVPVWYITFDGNPESLCWVGSLAYSCCHIASIMVAMVIKTSRPNCMSGYLNVNNAISMHLHVVQIYF